MKRTLTVLLILAMVVCLVPAFAVSAAVGDTCTITDYKNEVQSLFGNIVDGNGEGWYYYTAANTTNLDTNWQTSIPTGWTALKANETFSRVSNLPTGFTNVWDATNYRNMWAVRKVTVSATDYEAIKDKPLTSYMKHCDNVEVYVNGALVLKDPRGFGWTNDLTTFNLTSNGVIGGTALTPKDLFLKDNTTGDYYAYVAAHVYRVNDAFWFDMSLDVEVQKLEGDPYTGVTIANADEYLDYVGKVNANNAKVNGSVPVKVTVTGDLDFTGKTYTPIGSLKNTVLDFGGKTVSGITYTNNAPGNDAGIIATSMDNSVVKNLILKDSSMTISKTSGDTFFGGIVGWCNSSLVTDVTFENVTLTSNCNGAGQNGGVGGLIGAKDGVYGTGSDMENIVLKNLTINAPDTDAALVINRFGKGNSAAFEIDLRNVTVEKASVTSTSVSNGVTSALVFQNSLVDAGYALHTDEATVSLSNLTYNSKLGGTGNGCSTYYQTRQGANGTVDYRFIVVASQDWIDAMDKIVGKIQYTLTFKSADGADAKSIDLTTDTVYTSVKAQSGDITDQFTTAEGSYVFGWVVKGVPTDYASISGQFAPELTLNMGDIGNETYENTEFDGKTLKVLAIGNSFSDDSMEWLYKIAKAEGVETIVLGNLYWGGCDLQTHVNNAKNSVAQYSYRKNTNDQWITRDNSTLEYGITDEDWDIITMQQVSGKSGVYGSYFPYLQELVDYVNATKTNPDCRFAWNMTWAYQNGSTHADFPTYNSNQMTMYNNIVNTVQLGIVTRDDFPIILTPGTAIQNARTSFLGDTLTRDGYHLNYDIGRYIAGYTWFRILTGKELTELKYTHGFDAVTQMMVLEAVNAAATNPFSVTQSSYAEYAVNLDNYVEIEFKYTVGGYWNSTDGTRFNKVITDDTPTSPKFIATQLFNKQTLPVGSLIVVDEGYQYRPERWNAAAGVQTNRPGNVSTQYFTIPEDWWNGYTYRAFNVSLISGGSATDDFADHFRIYVPKDTPVSDETVSFPTK